VTDEDDDDLALRKGDYVELKDTGQTGRIVAAGSEPGSWRVRFDGAGEVNVAADRLEPTY
jgi:hypothetical protein